MSFDLKIVNNDISVSPNGEVDIVINTDKLIQDVIKILLTTQGTNKFYRWYGSTITQRVIGEVLGSYYTEVEIKRAIEDSLNNLMRLQQSQALYQNISSSETLAGINYIDITREDSDPRLYSIVVSVLTKKLTAVETTFQLRV